MDSALDCRLFPVIISVEKISGVAITGIPGRITWAVANMAKISAVDKITLPGAVIGAVEPDPGRLHR